MNTGEGENWDPNATTTWRSDLEHSMNLSSNPLKDAEQSASSKISDSDIASDIDGARQVESNIESDRHSFKNKVGEKANKITSKKSFMKNFGPIMSIIALIFGGGTGLLAAQTAMPFSLVSQFAENFDSINVSNQLRSRRILKMQMGVRDSQLVKSCVKPHIFKEDEFNLSEKQARELSKNGIELEESDGKTVMTYADAKGEKITIEAKDFDSVYESNVSFRENYDKGSRTWRGSVSAWFDNASQKFFKKLGVSRNYWKNWDSKTSTHEDYVQTIANGQKTNIEADVDTGKYNSETDEDGNTKVVKTEEGNSRTNIDLEEDIKVDLANGTADTKEISKKLKNIADSKLSKTSSVLQAGVNVGCTAVDVITAIDLIIVAYQTLQIVKTTMPILEGIQKAQAGDGSDSPIHEIANSLVTDSTMVYGSPINSGSGDVENKIMELTSKTTGSAMSSNAIASLYSDTAINTKDPSVKSFNPMTAISGTVAALGSNISSFKSCTTARMVAAAGGAALDTATIIGCFFTAGVVCAVEKLAEYGTQAAISVSAAVVANVVIGATVPYFASLAMRKIATEVAGEDLGNAIYSATHYLYGKNHLSGGGSIADASSFAKYKVAQIEVNEAIAREERESLSPFDLTSQYTFIGSIFNTTMPLLTQNTSYISIVANIGSVVSSSITSIMPSADALAAANSIQAAVDQTATNCLFLDSIGAVGDAFCNPIVITDTTTMSVDPAVVTDNLYKMGDIEISNSEEVSIKKDSNLAKWIVYCGERSSPYGMADQNIVANFATGSTNTTIGDALIGAIPIVGDTIDVLQNQNYMDNMGYITGEACVTNHEQYGNVPGWDSVKNYQRFVEDQRLLENMGVVETSAVTAFLDDYYEEHPLDQSFEGIIARYSGLTKETVLAALDYVDVMNWVAEYDPSGYGPYVKEEKFAHEDIQSEDIELEMPSALAMVRSLYLENRRDQNYAA